MSNPDTTGGAFTRDLPIDPRRLLSGQAPNIERALAQALTAYLGAGGSTLDTIGMVITITDLSQVVGSGVVEDIGLSAYSRP